MLEERAVELPHAIRSMTALPAAVFGMRDRGLLREGAVADLVMFDLERLRDRAEYQDPHQLAEGMVHVLVSGEFAVEAGRFTDARAGRLLRRGEP